MEPTSKRLSRTLWVGVGLVLLTLCGSFVLMRIKPLPPRTASLPVIGSVPAFALTNQDARAFTLEDLRGKPWVADIVFTRCAGPCPRLSQQMAQLQAALPPASPAQLVSLTTDPEFDTPAVLKKYAARFSADPARWHFLTGDQRQIATLAADGLKLSALEKPVTERTSADDLFIHSTLFVVVDKQARLRAVFATDETTPWTNVQAQIIATLRQLEHEP